MRLTVRRLPRDHSFLLAQHHGLSMLLFCTHVPNPDLFLQDQPPLDDDDFLHDRDDRDVSLLTNGRHDFNGPVDRNPLDFCPNTGQLLVDQLLPRSSDQSDLDVGLFNFAPGDLDLFDMERNVQIFWLPLVIGHALLSSHGSRDDAVMLNGLIQECAGPTDFWPPCGRALGPVLG